MDSDSEITEGMLMCMEIHHVRLIFEVQTQDGGFIYIVPGSCVKLVGDKTTPSSSTLLPLKYCRKLTPLEEVIYENCYSI